MHTHIFYSTDNDTSAFNSDSSEIPDQDLNETLDPANITDADAFKGPTQGINPFIQTYGQLAIDKDLEVLDSPIQPTNQTATGNMETTLLIVIIDQFSLGNAGAPISDMAQGSSPYKLYKAMHIGLDWASFKSQCN
jgi:hypothetical protein